MNETIEDFQKIMKNNVKKMQKLGKDIDKLHNKNDQLHAKIHAINKKNVKDKRYGVKNKTKGQLYTLIDIIKFTKENTPIFIYNGEHIVSSYSIWEMPNGVLFNINIDGNYCIEVDQAHWTGNYFETYINGSWNGNAYEADYDDWGNDGENEEEEIADFIDKMNYVVDHKMADRAIEKELSKK